MRYNVNAEADVVPAPGYKRKNIFYPTVAPRTILVIP